MDPEGWRVMGVATPLPTLRIIQKIEKNVWKQGKNKRKGKKEERNSYTTYIYLFDFSPPTSPFENFWIRG